MRIKHKKSNKKELKNKLNGNTFVPLRTDLVNSPSFITLSNAAKVVFIHMLGKYNGKNNGDISAPQNKAKSLFNLSPRGLKLALDTLIDKNFIEITRQGSKNRCSLYALTCFPMNNINKHDIYLKETHKPSDRWKSNLSSKDITKNKENININSNVFCENSCEITQIKYHDDKNLNDSPEIKID
ncbi:hypothetical protein, partial [Ursidibacter maritimus]